MTYEARNSNTSFLYERGANKFFKSFVPAVFDEFDGLPIEPEFVYIYFSSTPVDSTMTYEARNRKTILIYGREANKFRYFYNFQPKAAPNLANGSKKLFSHIEFTVQISSKSTNSVIFSFLS